MKNFMGRFLTRESQPGEGMTVQELTSKFPEIPKDLHQEAILSEFAASFGDLLRTAQDPSACSSQYSPANHYYLKLISPMKIYMYGLSSKEKLLTQLRQFLEQHAKDPEGFASTLLPDDTTENEVKGPGCN